MRTRKLLKLYGTDHVGISDRYAKTLCDDERSTLPKRGWMKKVMMDKQEGWLSRKDLLSFEYPERKRRWVWAFGPFYRNT